MQNLNKKFALLMLASLSCWINQAPAAENTQEVPVIGAVLPFPEPQSASVTGKTLADSKHQGRRAENHLPEDAPNIVIFMTDDAGFAN